MKKTLFQLAGGLSLFALSVPQAFAENTTIKVSEPGVGVTQIEKLITSGFAIAVIIGAVVMFAMLILGGYAWMTAGGDKAKVEEARTRITNGLIGLAVVAAAWAIMTVVSNFFGVSFTSLNIPTAAGT